MKGLGGMHLERSWYVLQSTFITQADLLSEKIKGLFSHSQ
jgi:hypothetical protein